MKAKISFFLTVCFLILTSVTAQELTSIPFDDDAWELMGEETTITQFKGKTSLYLTAGVGVLREANFKEGIIEFDMAFSESRGFPGVYFRIENNTNYEEFYVRPHQSGNPDASQYSPVNNGLSGWQLYHGPGFSGQTAYQFDTWMPVRIAVKGDEADIFIQDMETPMLHVNDLKRAPITGGIAVRGTPGGVYFANFRYSTEAPQALIGTAEPENPAGKTTVTSWAVSSIFKESNLVGLTQLGDDFVDALTWSTHPTEPSGMINLATTAAKDGDTNTVIARLILTSETSQTKKMTVSFSDRIRVYLNRHILFSGQDNFRSRDYRYLGTIGDFDDVYLQLREGENELLIAISEDFGGWGLRARFENTDGFSWEPQ